MKKLSILIVALAIFAGAQILVPSKSEAGVSCNYDVFGNYVCRETGGFGMGNSSSTRKDVFGNDVTTFKNQYGQTTGTMSCRTDVFGNYVCN